MNLLQLFVISQTVPSFLLVLAFWYLLYRNRKGSNLLYIRQIATYSIVSSVGMIINTMVWWFTKEDVK